MKSGGLIAVLALLLAGVSASVAQEAQPVPQTPPTEAAPVKKPAPAPSGQSPAPAPATDARRAPRLATPPRAVETEVVDPSRFGEMPTTPLPTLDELRQKPNLTTPQQAGSTVGPRVQPSRIDQERFGGKPLDEAYGAFQRGLYKTAYNLALTRAEAGDAAAQTLVAEILSRGLGVKRDVSGAAKWYELAAEQGVPEAQFQQALVLLDAKSPKHDPKAAYALMQAAAEAGNRLAQFNLAQMILQREPGEKGLAQAEPYFERAAGTGLADAQYAMAQYYANGIGGKKKDDVRARLLMVQAARQNHDTAQFDLSLWMAEGRGGDRDLKSAFGWMKLAAERGNVAARNRLAKYYVGGIGVDPDPVEAASWYMAARRAGLIDPEMEDHLVGLTDDEIKQAMERSDRIR
ncbi:tetratricopeptide repeat protein [Oryzicola mucosus]|nr:tetratricopeptide repeat protein [Oryzicola mucosus]